MQVASFITNQVKQLGQQIFSIKGVSLLNKDLFSVQLGKKNLQEGQETTYQNIYQFTQTEINLISETHSASTNFFTSFSSLLNPKYFAKLQSYPDPSNKKYTRIPRLMQILKIIIRPQSTLLQSLNLSQFHEDVLNNDIVGEPLVWNKEQTQLVYLAKQKPKEQKSFLQHDLINPEGFETGQNYRKFQQDWGEKQSDIIEVSLYLYDIDKYQLHEVNIPKSTFVAFPQFDQDGYLIFGGYPIQEFKYGLLHCFNRNSQIYRTKPSLKQIYPKPKDEIKFVQQQFDIISNDEVCVRPVVNVKGDQVMYYGSPRKHQHLCTLALKLIDLNTKQVQEIVPIIQENLSLNTREDLTQKNRLFNGKCGYYEENIKSFWASENHFLFISISSGQDGIFLVDINTKLVSKVSHLDNILSQNYTILKFDYQTKLLFATFENVITPPQLAILRGLEDFIINSDINVLKWISINPQGKIFHSSNEELEESYVYSGEAEGFLWKLKKPELPDQQRSIVTIVHGGPHGVSESLYSVTRHYLLKQGYILLLPNFTGSASYGQQYIEKLSGKIGEIDALEIVQMLTTVRKMGYEGRSVVMGGSYGGYMGGILGSRYGEHFNAAILLNPVLNIPFMLGISDIPEWCISTCLNEFEKWNLAPGEYKKMFDMSPMSQQMQVPTLLILGQKDRRVPYQAAITFHTQQLINQKEITTYLYPEADHSLADSLFTSFDVAIKSLLFIEEKCNNGVQQSQEQQ